MEKIMAYDWEDMIARILEGIKNFFDKVKAYMPKSYYNFEKPEEYQF